MGRGGGDVVARLMKERVVDELRLEHKRQAAVGALVDPRRQAVHVRMSEQDLGPRIRLVTHRTRVDIEIGKLVFDQQVSL